MTRPFKSISALEADAAARGALTKISHRKSLVVRLLEIILLPVVRAVGWLQQATFPEQQEPIKKILVVEFWQMGDAILLLPFLQNLRRHYPQAQIAWLGNPRVLPLLRSQGKVDEAIPVRVPWAQHFARWRKYNPFSQFWFELARTLLRLRREHYDMALSGRMDIRDNLLLWLIGARQRVGFGVGGGGFFLTDVATPDLEHPHRSYAWMRLLEHLGIPVQETRARLKLCKEQEDLAERFAAGHGIANEEIVVGFHAGVRIATRQWGIPNFLAVMERLRHEFSIRVLWFEEPAWSIELPGPCESVARVSLPLEGFLAVLARCDLLICNDSGPMHMAEALGVRVVAVFGPTQPAWFGPTAEGSLAIYRPEFWCRPCFDYCIFDQPYCLRMVSTEQVFEAAANVIRSLLVQRELATPPQARKHSVHAQS